MYIGDHRYWLQWTIASMGCILQVVNCFLWRNCMAGFMCHAWQQADVRSGISLLMLVGARGGGGLQLFHGKLD